MVVVVVVGVVVVGVVVLVGLVVMAGDADGGGGRYKKSMFTIR